MRDKEISDKEADAVFDPRRDNEKVYDRDIVPILQDLRAACRARGLPFYAVVQFSEYGLAQFVSVPRQSHGAFEAITKVLQEAEGEEIPPGEGN